MNNNAASHRLLYLFAHSSTVLEPTLPTQSPLFPCAHGRYCLLLNDVHWFSGDVSPFLLGHDRLRFPTPLLLSLTSWSLFIVPRLPSPLPRLFGSREHRACLVTPASKKKHRVCKYQMFAHRKHLSSPNLSISDAAFEPHHWNLVEDSRRHLPPALAHSAAIPA